MSAACPPSTSAAAGLRPAIATVGEAVFKCTEVEMFAVFACVKDKNRKLDVPCLDPLSWGMGDEPDKKLLCRRGRVQLFSTEQEAETAIGTTLVRAKMYGHKWTDLFDFVILQCQEPAKADTTAPAT